MRINDVGLSRHLLYYKYARRKELKINIIPSREPQLSDEDGCVPAG